MTLAALRRFSNSLSAVLFELVNSFLLVNTCVRFALLIFVSISANSDNDSLKRSRHLFLCVFESVCEMCMLRFLCVFEMLKERESVFDF